MADRDVAEEGPLSFFFASSATREPVQRLQATGHSQIKRPDFSVKDQVL